MYHTFSMIKQYIYLVMSKTKQYEIEVGQDLKDALKEYFDLADDRIMSAARHGVSEGINLLRVHLFLD